MKEAPQVVRFVILEMCVVCKTANHRYTRQNEVRKTCSGSEELEEPHLASRFWAVCGGRGDRGNKRPFNLPFVVDHRMQISSSQLLEKQNTFPLMLDMLRL